MAEEINNDIVLNEIENVSTDLKMYKSSYMNSVTFIKNVNRCKHKLDSDDEGNNVNNNEFVTVKGNKN